MKNNQLAFVAAAFLAAFNIHPAHGQGTANTPRHVEGELLVKFKGGPRGEAAARTKAAMKHEVKRHFDFIGWQQIKLPAGMAVEEGLARYKNLPDVLAAEVNYEQRAIEPVVPRNIKIKRGNAKLLAPTDSLLDLQYALDRIGASNAWNIATGSSNIVVAVIDTGVNYKHEDLAANMWRNPGEIPGNSIDDDGNGFIDDVYGIDTADDQFGNDSDPIDQGEVFYHGSACAGVIGAVANNGKGIAGLNWNVQIMALRALKATNLITVADSVQAMDYIVLMKGRGVNIRVVSMSWGGGGFSQTQKDALDAVAARGILQVAAAGNNGRDNDQTLFYPASYDTTNLISAAASDAFDGLASFSNYGRTNVDLAAPGVGIVMTHGPGTNAYTAGSGTSFATPYVAGAAALLAAAYPAATAAELKRVLMESADVLPPFTDKMVSNGRLNVARAMWHPIFASNMSPIIVSGPRSQTVAHANAAWLHVSAAGSEPLTYQWLRDGVEVANATNAVLSFTAVTTNDAGTYLAIVGNSVGSVTSTVARLAVDFSMSFTKITNGAIAAETGDAIAGSWGDYDGDGYADLFLAKWQGQNNALFRNNGDSSFTKITTGALVNDGGNSWEGVWGDFDRDSDLDLFVANATNQNNFFYRNDGGGVFTKMTAAMAGPLVADGGSSFNAAWADYDNNGWLDLFVSNGGIETSQSNFLYRNNTDGRFTRVTAGSIVNDTGGSFGAAWGDFDGDGFPDLFVVNFWGPQNFLYRNQTDGTFAKITTGPVASDSEPAFTSSSWGDYDNDGDLDLFVCAFGKSILYRNDGNGNFVRVIAGDLGNEHGDSYSSAWGDYDNDGFLDLFVASEGSGTHSLYRNNGDGTFSRINANSLGLRTAGFTIGCAAVDYDNDGFPDLFMAGAFGGRNQLVHNNGNTNHWLTLKLLGTRSNRNGVGAKIRVSAVIGGTNRWQMREIAGGGGWGAHGDMRAMFGTGDATNINLLRIEWPSGTVQELTNINANQFLTITEPGLALVRDLADTSVRSGSNMTLNVIVYSDRPLTFQWRFNGADLSGATNSSLQITNVQVAHDGDYSVVMNDGLHSVTSRTARVVVLMNPMILQAPLSQTVVAGGNVTVSVTVAGNPPPFLYQWRKGTLPAGALTNLVLNERTCFFTLTNLQANQGGTYRVVITNAAITNLNIGANFILTVLADSNTNGLPDVWEADYGVIDPLGDADGDGLNNRDEYNAGTNPTNALNCLKIEQSSAAGSNTLSFLAVSNKTYTVEFTEALGNNSWIKAADFVARPTNRTESLAVSPSANERYYRVVTPRRP